MLNSLDVVITGLVLGLTVAMDRPEVTTTRQIVANILLVGLLFCVILKLCVGNSI